VPDIDRLGVEGVRFGFCVFGGGGAGLGDFVAEGEGFLGAFRGWSARVAAATCCWHLCWLFGGLLGWVVRFGWLRSWEWERSMTRGWNVGSRGNAVLGSSRRLQRAPFSGNRSSFLRHQNRACFIILFEVPGNFEQRIHFTPYKTIF